MLGINFTYKSFAELIALLRGSGYSFANFTNHDNVNKPVILRHDIDLSLGKALELARIEHENNVSATYFVLLSTDFYNIFSIKSNEILVKILGLNHEIGLHFDETRYGIESGNELEFYIERCV